MPIGIQANLSFFLRSRNEDYMCAWTSAFILSVPPKTRSDKRKEHVLRRARDVSLTKPLGVFSCRLCIAILSEEHSSSPLTGANTSRDISQLHFFPPRVNLHRLFDGRNFAKYKSKRFKVFLDYVNVSLDSIISVIKCKEGSIGVVAISGIFFNDKRNNMRV